MSETGPDLPKDPKAWAEYLRKIDYKDHKKAMLGLGAAAAFGLGVGAYALSKKYGGKTIFVSHGDRYREAKGTISIGISEENGVAVGVPTSEDSLEKVGSGREVFSMDPEEGFGFPLENADHVEKHTHALRRAADWLIDRFSSQEEPEK